MRMIKRILLASGSPRRRDILEQAGVSFYVRPSGNKEIVTKTLPEEIVEELSRQKALDVFWASQAQLDEDTLVLGADTIVTASGVRLGKPASEADAVRMLHLLEGKVHRVCTGVTLVIPGWIPLGGKSAGERLEAGGREWTVYTFHAVTGVKVAGMTEREIEAYVRTGEPMDKAGAYAIQGRFARYIESIDGEYNNVVGLPAARIFRELNELGVSLETAF